MKKILLTLSLFSCMLLSSCDVLKNIASGIPSQLEMALGLKDALSQGLFRSFNAFADPNGNPLVRFAFPGEAAKIEQALRNLGLDKKVDQVTGKFTRAMSSAVTAAKPMFVNAIKEMSIKDAVKILITDNNHAATNYFKSSMYNGLMDKFRPIVDNSIQLEGAGKDWTNIAKVYNSIPFIKKPLENSLTDFIAARAIDGMFAIVGSEEAEIRNKYELRKTDMMKKVFGYADQELKKRQQGVN